MTDVSFNGFTWTLAETVSPVLDVLGEPCVAGPVTLTAKTPAMIGADATTRHGSMVNPVSLIYQGYDGRMAVGSNLMGYNPALNADAALPVALSAGSSLCSMESGNLGVTNLDSEANAQMMEKFACMTVMDTVPAAGTFFRPPYAGTNKPVFLTSQVRTDFLPAFTMTSDPVVTQTVNEDFKIDSPTWLGLPQYNVIQPSEKPNNRMAPRYQQQPYPAYKGKIVGQLGVLAASNHPRRVEFLYRLIRHGIDCAYALRATSDGLFLNGAGYGNGGYFLCIAVAGHYLQSGEILEVLTREWANASGQWQYGNPDILGERVGAFWEQTTLYHSPSAWTGYALPKPRGDYPNGPPLYGDMIGTLTIGMNNSGRDPLRVYHGTRAEAIRYPEHALKAADKWGTYMRVSSPSFIGQFIAAKLLGVAQYYPQAARDYFEVYINDPKLWHDEDLTLDAYKADVYGFGGSGNGFMRAMWEAYGPTIVDPPPPPPPPAPPAFQSSMTLRVKM